MTDFYGIGAAVRGAVRCYFQAARRTGRTSHMIDNVREGDLLVFGDHREARRVEDEIRRKRGKDFDVRCEVVDVRDPASIWRVSRPAGRRVILDHGWVEDFYTQVLEIAADDIAKFQEVKGDQERARTHAPHISEGWENSFR